MNLQMRIMPKNKEGAITPGGEYRYHSYGDSAIAAIAAAKMGGDCVFATRFGDDMNGKRLYEYYKDCGISKRLMRKDNGAQTGMCVTVYNDHGEYESYLSEGASLRFTREEIDEAFTVTPDLFLAPLEEIGYEEHMVVVPAEQTPEDTIDEETAQAFMPDLMIETSDFPVSHPAEIDSESDSTEEAAAEEDPDKMIASETVSSYIEQESLARYAVELADSQNIDLLVQYTPFTSQYPLSELKNIKLLVISDEMLYHLTGFFPNNTEKALRALVALSEQVKAKYYIVQQGDDSVFVYDGNRYEIVSAPEALRGETRRVGANMPETFIGALAAEYLETKNIVRACRFGIVAAMLTKAKFGNLEKMMSRTELEQYLADRNIDLDR